MCAIDAEYCKLPSLLRLASCGSAIRVTASLLLSLPPRQLLGEPVLEVRRVQTQRQLRRVRDIVAVAVVGNALPLCRCLTVRVIGADDVHVEPPKR